MFVVMVRNDVEPGCRDGYVEESRAFAADMRSVPGCLDAQVLEGAGEQCDGSVTNLEIWESKATHDAYDGAAFLAHKAALKKGFLGNETSSWVSL